MINSVSSTSGANVQSSAKSSGSTNNVLGQDDFMKLLVAQMQAQDPLDPMDSSDFSAQLAQFSALEQMRKVNTNIENLIQVQGSINNNMAVNLIGKSIVAPGNNLTISNGQPDVISYELGKNATSVTISIHDSGNNLVASIVNGAETVGTHNYTWNGKNSNGKILPNGNYTFQVSAVGASGSPVVTRTLQNSKVTGISFVNGTAFVVTENNSKTDVKDITSVNATL